MTPAERTAMTDKPTLEEIESRLTACDEAHRDVLTGGYGVRLLEICREQAGTIRADDERLETAAIRVWGEHVRGCDTAELMADLIVCGGERDRV